MKRQERIHELISIEYCRPGFGITHNGETLTLRQDSFRDWMERLDKQECRSFYLCDY